MTVRVGRNDPCPCGSGRKYKHCCEGKLQLGRRIQSGGWWPYVALALAAVAIAGIVFAKRGPNRATMATPGSPPVAGANTEGPPAAPWTFDPATNRHFDPSHNHWHEGPPPPAAQRGPAGTSPTPTQTSPAGATPTASAPAPWTYDSTTNQHWDPNHGHWHPGRPPATNK